MRPKTVAEASKTVAEASKTVFPNSPRSFMCTKPGLRLRITERLFIVVGGWGVFKRMRPQPGNALQEGRDASEKGECWKRTCGVRLVFCCSSLLFSAFWPVEGACWERTCGVRLVCCYALLRGAARRSGPWRVHAGNGPVGSDFRVLARGFSVEKIRRAPRGEVVRLV